MAMNREIFRIAVPNIISNITVPLMGIFSTAIAGHAGDSTLTIGALAVGVSIFNFIYWNCSFIRMGTSGITAQAFGAKDYTTTTAMLVRAVGIAIVMGVLMLVLQYPLGEVSLWVMNGSQMVADYFYARIWAVPAGIMLFAINGWFTGMQNAVIPMCTAIFINVLHLLLSLWFVFGLDMGIVGIAYASVVSQWSGMLLSVVLLILFFRHTLTKVTVAQVLDMTALKEFFVVNGDIVVRTFCNVAVYTFFTAASARMGSDILLAVNTMLMQLFTLFSYMNDGFAYAAEALTGRFIGAKDYLSLKRCLKYCVVWAMGTAVVAIVIYVGWWQDIFGMFVGEKSELPEILNVAGRYIGWVIAIPAVGAMPFLMDGVMVGATLTRILRNSMVLSTILFFALYYTMLPLLGNNALWLSFITFLGMRGIAQYLMSKRLKMVYDKAL